MSKRNVRVVAQPKQFAVTMEVTRIEHWTVEAVNEEDARRKAMECDTVDEMTVDVTDWEIKSVREDS
jgi:hypothetical protein